MAPTGPATPTTPTAPTTAATPDTPTAATAPAAALAALRVPAPVADRFRAAGWWRDETFLHDLYRTAALDPGRPAIVADRSQRPEARRRITLSYAQLAIHVDRFAAALASLGITAGDPVAYQLPNWWEAAALTLACLRLGALAVPVLPTVRTHGLNRILSASQARICVVPDVWDGFGHAEALAGLAPGLPWLRHRVVLGEAEATGAVDFERYFLRTPHERRRRLPAPAEPLADPLGGPAADPTGATAVRGADPADRAGLLVTVMGLADSFSSVLHSPNTLYANASTQLDPLGPGMRPGEAFYSPLPLTSLASLIYTVYWPLAVGGTGVYQDVWDPARCLELLAAARVDQVYAAPVYWAELLTAQRQAPTALDSLRLILCGGRTSTPPELPGELAEAFGVPVRTVWGAPELGLGTLADPTGDGGALLPAGLELALDGEPARLLARGPQLCLARWPHGDPAPEPTWERADGWLDTGDSAAADGHGGLRVVAHAGERTGSIFMVPVAEVEAGLLAHPLVQEAAVVSYTDGEYGELPCAVVVPAAQATPPGLVALREHLAALGLAEAFRPTRLELVGSLPRDAHGAVRKDVLRGWLDRLRPGVPRSAPA
ncbi:AMP-binding protein [Kitasatospora sp. NBC_01287]|uniref:AMP-binding protein n=1 Tax=Kitasatospora sp. NBC_01287 TaxID=2903573 RepID=UPI00224EAC13|nr:AMP-binding protein [Kitasatospora sp. NBC_01287]MCX4750342.1 AMP-binding protein [Kitasatospora sp. NBC_01287]